MRDRSRFRNLLEAALGRPVLWLCGRIPDTSVPRVSAVFGRLLARVLGGRRRVVRKNLEIAWPDPAERPDEMALARASFASLCRSFMELARMPRDPERARARVNWRGDGLERIHAALENGPVVFAAAHFGAYEMISATSPLFGIDAVSIVRPLDNPHLERWLDLRRRRFGHAVTPNRGAARSFLEALREGRSVAILHDINLRSPKAVFVDYFGVPAATAPTAGVLAHRTGAPLVPLFCHRTEKAMHFEIEVAPFLYPRVEQPREEETRRLLGLLSRELEVRVREDPTQWLWTHRRWKTRPGDYPS